MSTGSSAMSAATGQTEPTSSSRWRRSDHPTGRGLEVSKALIASISFIAMMPIRSNYWASKACGREHSGFPRKLAGSTQPSSPLARQA